jgi:hypothetical protein
MINQIGASVEYDAWAQLGAGDGWSWDGLSPYFNKVIGTLPPAPPRRNGPPIGNGDSGTIPLSYNNFYTDLDAPFIEALNQSGIPLSAEPVSIDDPFWLLRAF